MPCSSFSTYCHRRCIIRLLHSMPCADGHCQADHYVHTIFSCSDLLHDFQRGVALLASNQKLDHFWKTAAAMPYFWPLSLLAHNAVINQQSSSAYSISCINSSLLNHRNVVDLITIQTEPEEVASARQHIKSNECHVATDNPRPNQISDSTSFTFPTPNWNRTPFSSTFDQDTQDSCVSSPPTLLNI